MRFHALLPVAVSVTALTTAFTTALTLAPTYTVTRRTTLGGDGGWDYLTVDTAAHRLYISRGTHVQVVNTDTDALVGDIPDTPGVHGIALDIAAHHGYTSNGRDSTVTVFDTRTLAPLRRVPVPARNPDAIMFDDFSQRVFTFNGGSASTTAIAVANDSVVGTLALGGKPEFANSDGTGTIFVNIEDTHEIVAFDAKALTVTHRWNLAGCEDPTGQALDRAHHRLFATCGNKVMVVIDSRSGAPVATVPIGDGSDGVMFDDARQLAISANGDGSMTVVHEDTPRQFTVTQTVTTMPRARTLTIDRRTHALYTVSATFGAAPAPTPATPRPRPPMVAGSFTLLTIAAP
jgi:DNA-binding beta-propeller fold protein YncE